MYFQKMYQRNTRETTRSTLIAAFLLYLLCLTLSPVHGQIFNGKDIVVSTADSSSSTTSTSAAAITTPPPPPAPTTTTPVSLQPYTTIAPSGSPVGAGTPLPLPTTPALFPQNVSTCSTCYGMFPTLSRCNVIANTGTFPIMPNTTYQSLLPFLKCICTYKALDAYPYCIDCFTKTQQLNQLNVLQANHLENYMDAFRQLCGVTYNGNKVPVSGTAKRTEIQAQTTIGLVSLASILLTSLFTTM